MSNNEYQPIDCSLHDQLESAAILRKEVRITFRDSAGGSGQVEDRIVDIFTRGGVEYVRLAAGPELRLDDLQEVDGVSFREPPHRPTTCRTAQQFVIIFGPPAVGKMAVGQELARITGLRLFHNHMALEPVLQIFPFGSPPFNRLVRHIRNEVFRELAASDLPGLIYTCMWDLTSEEDRTYIDEVCELFRTKGAVIHFVELYAPLEERLRRNRTELRLREKPSKRDVVASEERLRARESDRKMNSAGDFFYPESHMRIDNTDLSAAEAAKLILGRLRLPAIDAEVHDATLD